LVTSTAAKKLIKTTIRYSVCACPKRDRRHRRTNRFIKIAFLNKKPPAPGGSYFDLRQVRWIHQVDTMMVSYAVFPIEVKKKKKIFAIFKS
jgi:hypothetical protein